MNDRQDTRRLDADLNRIKTEPYYEALGGEIALFEAAYSARVPVLLKGPTGCGKTRFVEHKAWRLKRPLVFGAMTRNLKGSGLDEGASTRLLVHAVQLMRRGVAPAAACSTNRYAMTIVQA